MPTKDQCEELINNTDHEWISINEINGRKFTSKSDTSKYIFLPAGSNWLSFEIIGDNHNSIYWSTTKYTSYIWDAWLMHFTSDTSIIRSDGRRTGLPIRGIRPWTW